MVIDLNQPVTVSDALVLPPSAGFGYRVVIDLFPTNRAKFDSLAGWPADLKKRESDAEKLAALIAAQQSPPVKGGGKKVIVLDPGHGGLDAGTIGVNGLMEKDLALAEGLKLRKLLQARGYTVFMTRDNDTFIPLRQRVAIGRADKADLFIALHADSNPDSDTTGTSIYTLNDGRSDREASALARRENQSDVIAGVDLSGDNNPVAPILIGLAQRDTRNKSSEFATNALKSIGQVTELLAHQPAPFRQPGGAGRPRCSRGSDRTWLSVQSWRCGANEHRFLAQPGLRKPSPMRWTPSFRRLRASKRPDETRSQEALSSRGPGPYKSAQSYAEFPHPSFEVAWPGRGRAGGGGPGLCRLLDRHPDARPAQRAGAAGLPAAHHHPRLCR